jgi:hypothetical protein
VHDLSVVDRDDGEEPVVVWNACRENRTVHFAFEDNNTAVLSMMHDKLISRMQPDIVAIPGKLSHQIGPSLNRSRPTRKVIEKLEKSLIGNRVEIMLAINEAA